MRPRTRCWPAAAVFAGDGTAINSGPLRRTSHRGVQAAHRRRPGGRGPGPRGGELQAPRLALQPAAFLGRAVSDLARAGRRRAADRPDARRAGRGLAGGPARDNGLQIARQPDPPLDKAPADWLFVTLDGKRYKRETNTMPQWAGSCWYYLRFLDPKNDKALVDPRGRAGLDAGRSVRRRRGTRRAAPALCPLLAQGALRPRAVSTSEPFQKLVNQGMILGEIESPAIKRPMALGSAPRWSTPSDDAHPRIRASASRRVPCAWPSSRREKQRRKLRAPTITTDVRLESRVLEDVESPRQRGQSGRGGAGIRGRRAAAVRDVHGPAGGHQAVEHGRASAACAASSTACGG